MTRVLIVVGLLCFFNGYVAVRLINRWPWAQNHLYLIWIIALCFFLLQLAGPFGDRLFFPKLQEKFDATMIVAFLDWASYGAIGILSCSFLYTVAADIINIAWIAFASPENTVDFDRHMLLTLGALTFGTSVVGIMQAEGGPKVHEVEIPLKNLPPEFDGFKIAQISDLHVSGMIGRSYTQNVVNITNQLKPDLIALTGDFVDGTVENLKDDVSPLGTLEAPYGKFYVTGNHEYYWGASEWIAEFKALNMKVLSNEHALIEQQKAKIIIAGVTDYSTLRDHFDNPCSPKKSLEGAPLNLVKILLAHQPVTYSLAHDAGFDLQLSGHTHAGQYFPVSLFIGFFQRYYKGLNRHKDMWVYVNKGTGFWGPPLRTAVPSEITLITLRPEAA